MRILLLGILILTCLVSSACSGSLPSAEPLPPGVTFGGIWDSNWGQIKLLQQGSHVSGRYKGFRNGSVSGDLDGNVFIFKWTQMESRQWGRGYLKMSPDGERLEGRWGYKKNYTNGGRWWATRAAHQG
jgi:hypothetical protein